MNAPPKPAINDPIANANSLIFTTSTPAAAAERSLARIATMADPHRLRRKRAMPVAVTASTISIMNPNRRCAVFFTLPIDTSMPNNVGFFTSSAPLNPTMSVLRNQAASSATARAMVTTATVSPRTRRAGMPMIVPSTAAKRADMSGAIGNGICQDELRNVSMCAEAPARVSCANEI